MTAPDADPNTVPTPRPPDAKAAWGGWEDALIVVLLVVATLASRYSWAPHPSRIYPGIMAPSVLPHVSDSPSMDEVWDLALSNGRGSPFDHNPRDTLMHHLPAVTNLADAAPWWKVWTTLDGIIHPPLYLVTLRLWRSALGGGDEAAVGFSVLWSCVTAAFVYLAVLSAVGRTAAFWSGAIFAASPVASYLGLEIRSYAMLTAECAAALWLLVRLTKHGPRWRDIAGLNAAFLACMLTHYFAAPACLAAGVYAFIIAGRQWSRVLVGGAISGAIYLAAWGPFFLRQIHVARDGTEFLRTHGPERLARLGAALLLPLRLLGETGGVDWLAVVPCVLVLLGVVYVAVRRPAVRPFVVWYVAVVGFLLATDVLRQMQQLSLIRYSAAAQPAAVAFVPILAAYFLRRDWAIHAASVAACVIAVYTQQDAVKGEAPTFTTAALAIAPLLAPDDVLLLYADMTGLEVEYATDGTLTEFSRIPGCFPRDAAILYHPMSPELAAQLRGRRAWLLSFDSEDDLAAIVPAAKVIGTSRFYPLTTLHVPCTAYRLEFSSTPATTAAAVTRP